MELGLFLNTHGVTNRDEQDWWHQAMDPDEMKPVESAQMAERLGFHSVWFGDHVSLPEESPDSFSPIGGPLRRHYPPQPNLLDGAVVMGAIAANTERIKMGPSVLIAPYRHPLNDARQFATIDYLSGGRLIFGVGAGWMKEEFEALGHDFHARRRDVLEECIQIYDQAWREGVVTFKGEFYSFENMGIFPRPVQRPRPPIVLGATTKGTARLIGRRGDGMMPLLTRSVAEPQDFDHLRDEIRAEAKRVGRDTAEIAMLGLTSFRITSATDEESTRARRWNFGGTAEQILEDLATFADHGYAMLTMAPICPSRTYAEFEEQAEWLAREVLPEAKKLTVKGEWSKEI